MPQSSATIKKMVDPSTKTSFKTLITREHTADADDEQKVEHSDEPKSPAASHQIDLRELLELDPELDKLLN